MPAHSTNSAYLLFGQQGLAEDGLPQAVDLRPTRGDLRWNCTSNTVQGFDGVKWRTRFPPGWQTMKSGLEGNVHSRAFKFDADGKTLANWEEFLPQPLIRDVHGEGGVMRVERGQLVPASQRDGGQGGRSGNGSGGRTRNATPAPKPIRLLPTLLPVDAPAGSFITHPSTGRLMIYRVWFSQWMQDWMRRWQPVDSWFDKDVLAAISRSPLYKLLEAKSKELQGATFEERLPIMADELVAVLEPRAFGELPPELRELMAVIDTGSDVAAANVDLPKVYKWFGAAAVVAPLVALWAPNGVHARLRQQSRVRCTAPHAGSSLRSSHGGGPSVRRHHRGPTRDVGPRVTPHRGVIGTAEPTPPSALPS